MPCLPRMPFHYHPKCILEGKLISSYFRFLEGQPPEWAEISSFGFISHQPMLFCYRHIPMASPASDLFSATQNDLLHGQNAPLLPSNILPLFQSPPVGDHRRRTKPFLLPGASKSLRSCPLSTSAVSSLPRPWHLDQFISSSPIATHFLPCRKLSWNHLVHLYVDCFLSLFPLKIEAQPWLSCLQLMSRIETGAWKVISK